MARICARPKPKLIAEKVEPTMEHTEPSAPADALLPVISDQGTIRMIQVGCVIIIALALLDLLTLLQDGAAILSWASSSILFDLSMGCTILIMSRSAWFLRNWAIVVWIILVTMTANGLLLGIVGGEPILLFVSLMLLMAGTGSLLPWSASFQGSLSLVCIGAWGIQHSLAPAFDHNETYRTIGLLGVAGVAQFACYVRLRYVREHEHSQRRIKDSEAALREIFDANTDAITVVDFETRLVVDVNAGFVRVTGSSRTEAIGKTLHDLRIWANPADEVRFVAEIRARGSVRNMSIDILAKDGKAFPCLVSSAIVNIQGRPCVMTLARDITELNDATQKLRNSEAMLREIFDSSLDNMSLIDLSDGSIIDVNKELLRSMGYAKEEVVGKTLVDLAWADSSQQHIIATALRERGEVRNFPTTFRARDGRLIPVLISATVLELNGRVCALSIGRDVTDLEAAREAALAAAKAKSEFFSSMSHEIRTPMNAILGMADLLSEGNLDSEQRRFLDLVISNGNALLELINSILDLAKVENGKLKLEATEFDLIDLIQRLADGLAVRAHQKQVKLGVRFSPDLPANWIGDGFRLRQVMTNVIGNAIKFTERGEVMVSVSRNPNQDKPGNILLSVRDTGIGIAPDDLATIFSVFTQADSSTTRKYGGTGLGLAIVERLVTQMGGRVWVESAVGKGSTFYVTIDLVDASQRDAFVLTPMDAGSALGSHDPERQEETDVALRLLLADDSLDNRLLVRAYLKKTAHTLDEVDNGLLALELFQQREYDLVLMDIQMPVLDGYSAVSAIRKWERENNRARTPIIALSASALEEDVIRAKEAGCDLHVSKPVKKAILLDAIASITKNHTAEVITSERIALAELTPGILTITG